MKTTNNQQEIINWIDSSTNKNTSSYIILAQQRFIKDCQNDKYFIDWQLMDKIVNFFGEFKHYTGKFNGQPFILSTWQKFLLLNIFCVKVKNTGLRKYQQIYCQISRKNGKDQDINTKIPTPCGWTTIGNIKIGDKVFNRYGDIVDVIDVTDIQLNKNYIVEFEDGEKTTCGEDHLWFVKNRYKDNIQVKKTKELLNVFRIRKDKKGTEYTWRVPMNESIDLPYKNLSLDPYLLGLWLADGDKNNPRFIINNDDSNFLIPYFFKTLDKNDSYCFTAAITDKRDRKKFWFENKLIELNLIGNKHIPEDYLRASFNQRLILLQGFMDGDGYIDKRGQCEFVQKNNLVTDGICELLSSLGIKYNRRKKIPTINGVPCDEVNRVTFFTDKTKPCFLKCERKYNRLKDKLNKRMLYKSIISITPTETIPTKCISVTGDNSYLFGKHFTVTHNSSLVAVMALWGLLADNEPNSQIVVAANTMTQADIVFKMANTYLRQRTKKGKTYRTSQIMLDNNELFIVSSDASKQDGLNPSIFILDEYHEAKNNDMFQVLRSGQGARSQPLGIIITTAGFNKASACYSMRNYSIEVLNGEKQDDILFPLIFELDKGDDPYNEKTKWIKSNPNLNITVSSEYIENQLIQAKQDVNSTAAILTKTLNIWQDSKYTWIPESYIKDTIITESEWFEKLQSKKNYLYCGCDLSDVSDLSAVSYMFYLDKKYYFNIKYYLPENFTNYQQNMMYYRSLAVNGQLTLTPGNTLNENQIISEILEMNKLGRIVNFLYDPYNAKFFIEKLKSARIPNEPFSQTVASFNSPTKHFQKEILSGNVHFVENELTFKGFNDVVIRKDYNSNEKPEKQDDYNSKIDGIIASIQAIGAWILDDKKRL